MGIEFQPGKMRSLGDDAGDGYVTVPLSDNPENDSGGKFYVIMCYLFYGKEKLPKRGRRNKHEK